MVARFLSLPLLLVAVVGLAACGGSEPDASSAASSAASSSADGLTEAQLENGIGPVEQVTLSAEIEADLAAQGETIFNMKCSACHKMDQRYVGPPLGDVAQRRTPAFVMNMMLNPEEMLEKHPAAREMLAQYMTPMPNQSLTRDDARAILEFLRAQSAETASSQ